MPTDLALGEPHHCFGHIPELYAQVADLKDQNLQLKANLAEEVNAKLKVKLDFVLLPQILTFFQLQAMVNDQDHKIWDLQGDKSKV